MEHKKYTGKNGDSHQKEPCNTRSSQGLSLSWEPAILANLGQLRNQHGDRDSPAARNLPIKVTFQAAISHSKELSFLAWRELKRARSLAHRHREAAILQNLRREGT
jgi:hypothetical protein